MAEHWFYHLTEGDAVDVLPMLLEKTLGRGWRAAVQCRDDAQLARLDDALWTYRDESFLPHGRADHPHAPRQPILLSLDGGRANGAQALFVLGSGPSAADGSPDATEENVERVVILFEDNDDDMRGWARHRWRALSQAGADVSYWRRGPDGRWRKQ